MPVNNFSNTIDHEVINDNINIEQIKQIYKQVPITIIGPVFGAFVTAAMLKNHVSLLLLACWLLLVCISYALFIKPWLFVKKTGINKENVNKLASLYTGIGWLAVSSWGSVSFFLFVPDSFNAQLLLAMAVIVGMSAIMSSTIIYSPVFYTVIAMSLPMVVMFMFQKTEIHYYLATGCLGYTVMLFFLHQSMHKSMIGSLRLQFINEQLADHLNIQKERADKANLDKSKFLAAISHDLRQPLHAHSLFFGELQNRLEKQTIFSDLVNKLELSLESMSGLFNTLLDLSKLEAGVIKPSFQSFYLQDVINEIEREYTVKAMSNGVLFRVVGSSNVVRSDKIMLGRIVRNLLENAIKHNSRGKILLGCRRKGNSVVIQIMDNGVGIDENEQKYIFDEYYQIGKDKKNNIGMGLGLSVVKEQCALLGHTITLSSIINKGSVFSVEVPVSSKDKLITDNSLMNIVCDTELMNLNVIIIDDDVTIQQAMSGVLLSWGCSTIVGSTADEVLKNIDNEWMPDLIVSDYNLNNGATGFDAIEELRKAFGNEVRAAIITGDITDINQKELTDKKYPLLQKPVNLTKLRTLLRFLKC